MPEPKDAVLDKSLQHIIDGVEDNFLVIDGEYRVRFANAATGYSLCKGTESPVGKHCYEVLQGRDKPCGPPLWKCLLNKVLQSGSSTTLIHHYRNKYIKLAMWPLKDSQDKIDALVELRRDVTAERELEREILRRHHHLDALSRISFAVSTMGEG